MNVINLITFSYFFLVSFAQTFNDMDNYKNEVILNINVKNNTNQFNENKMKFLNREYKEKTDIFDDPHTIKREKTQNVFMRKIRNLIGNSSLRLECLACRTNGSSNCDDNCYRGLVLTTKKCKAGQQCYIELHPHYIKRGCVSRDRLNRTFLCNCPLCNDKPSNDFTYYEYEDIRDWKYQNKLLQNRHIGIDLLCKICETKGKNLTMDKICRLGKFANYMVCGQNQVCFVNIDGATSFVSRGCTNLPAHNTFYQYRDSTLCNKKSFYNDKNFLRRTMHLTSVNSQINVRVKMQKGLNIFLFSWILILKTK